MTRAQQAGFGLLCVLLASQWLARLLEDQYGGWPPLLDQAVAYAVLAVVGWSRCWRCSFAMGRLLEIAWWGAILFSAPLLFSTSFGPEVTTPTRWLVFTLVPVATVFALAQRSHGFGGGESPLRLLAPSLAGVAGAALFLPVSLPGTVQGRAGLAALLLAATLSGVGLLRLHGLLQRVVRWQAVATLASGAAVSALLGILMQDGTVRIHIGPHGLLYAIPATLLAGAVLLLGAWLLPAVRPVSYSASYLAVPLIAIVEGALLSWPVHLSWTMAAGLVLLLWGAAALWLADEPGVAG